jgi:hypothetical protein
MSFCVVDLDGQGLAAARLKIGKTALYEGFSGARHDRTMDCGAVWTTWSLPEMMRC